MVAVIRLAVLSLVASLAATAPLHAELCPAEGTIGRCGICLAAANDAQSLQCRIKGNVSAKGERIYHLPGGEFYDRTQINAAKGERWFCTEGEARAAGWRRSKR